MALLYVSIFAVGCWLLCHSFLYITQDVKEPPMINHIIPYIGHLVGLRRHGVNYFGIISATYGTSVYTLRLPWTKIYVVSSPRIVTAVDRHASTLSLAPFALEFIKRITSPSKRGLEILEKTFRYEKGARTFHSDTMRAMAVSLAPGTGLENATCGMLESTLRYLDLTKPSQSGEFDLFLWVRSLLTQASTDALYGVESNPFQDPTVQSGLWTVKKNLSSLMLNILPKILCSEGHHARLAVFAGFRKYYRERGHESASRMIKTRYEVLQQYNLSVEDIAHFDLNVCLGLLINTVPATYWALYYVYSQPSLLEEVREAISPYVQITADGPRRSVNIAEVVVKCPLVTSIVRETLRVQSVSSSARKVLKDTFVDGQYLLKQGSTVLIPTAEVHGPSSVSGTSSSTFDIRRYSSNKASETKKPDSPFRAFGGGSFLCPGRFFAENEMKVILVIMILKYDLETVEHKSWPWPQTRSSLASAIQAPRSDIRVKMLKRKGYESGFWDFEWRGKGTHLDFPTR